MKKNRVNIKKSCFIFGLVSLLVLTGCPKTPNGSSFLQSPSFEINNSSMNVIVYRDPATLSSSTTMKSMNSVTIKSVKPLGVEVLQVPSNMTVNNFMEELKKDPSVTYAEPDYQRKATLYDDGNLKQNDSKLDLQRYMLGVETTKNKIEKLSTSDPDRKLQYGLDKINAERAWSVTKGSPNIVIAVIDTGIDLSHPDLKENIAQGYSTIKDVSSPSDDNGHGTHVSGIIVAANNNKGGVGIAPKCKVMPIKVLTAKGVGNDSDISEGIVWAVDHGAKIISMSLGGPEKSNTLERAIQYAYNNDVLVVAAMGNNGDKIKNYPAAYNNVIAVGASDINNKITSFSNFGDWITVSAPGLKIYSTFPTYKVELNKYNNLGFNYGVLTGTSMSTPFVSGLAGLILSKNPNLKRADIRKLIEQSSIDIEKTGFDDTSGFGVIDAYKSLIGQSR